ncbi:MAG: LruC domain-containing protein [Bacteroidetes bacterium]|nr:LruC domain-containing protein [Bacteroidota bacterium]MBU1579848.1 LruC domain-containing protein [Bacteroidota bacterium]MBU2556587.1 LruC domain-containing protein [Bacteroidota bacterium]
MKTLKIVSISIFVLLALGSCKKEYGPKVNPDINQTGDLQVPESFNWKTTKDLSTSIALPEDGFYPLQSKITIYQGNPFQGGTRIAEGSMSRDHNFEQQLRIPAYLESLFLYLETSTGATHLVEVPLSGNYLNYTFPGLNEKQLNFKSGNAVQDDGPECDDCDQVISGNGNVQIKQGKTYCVQDNYTGNVTFQAWNGGGTLKICGTADINSNISLGSNCHIIVTQGGSLTLNGLQMWGTNNSVKVYANSSLIIENQLSTTGEFENHGTMSIGSWANLQQLSAPFINTGTLIASSGMEINNEVLNNSGSVETGGTFQLNTNSSMTNTGSVTTGGKFELNGSTLSNDGTFTVTNNGFSINSNSNLTNNGDITLDDGDFNMNSGGTLINNGSVTVDGKINFNSGGNVYNNCKMTCTEQSEFNSGNINFDGGYFRSDTKIQINGGANTILNNGSMISTPVFILYTNITGQGSLNSIKAETEFKLTNVDVSGAIESSTDNLNNLSNTPLNQLFVNGATLVGLGEEQNFLAATNCNPEGIGSVVVNDSDGDGVPDDLDEYPNDEERAFRSFYPNENDFTTIAFEDLWPGLGDFDFNDVVVIMQYEMVTNADNELVDLNGKFRLMAAGASLNNGFAVAIDINPANVSSVTGGTIAGSAVTLSPKGFESGHTDQTVWIVLDAINDIYQNSGFINTMPGIPYVETDTIVMSMTLSTPQANYGSAPFNPFIFIDQERGKEIHLLDHAPTSLASDEFFGIWEDASVPASGSYYKTASNLPWAIEIPVSFDYPFEKVDILQTHLKFADWATSGGDLFPDWFLDLPGYRNEGNIYQKP